MTGQSAVSTDTLDITAAEESLIGRDSELARILTALAAVGAGHGGVVLLSGEPGVGKTRLGRAVLAHAQRSGARTSIGRSFEQYTAIPFFPFTEALTLPLVGKPLLPEARTLERWPELGCLLTDIGTESGLQAGHDSQLRVFRAVTAFLRAAADVNPLVLMLDDLHWADATSLSLLLYLSRHLESARVFVLGTYRDTEVGREPAFHETLSELVRDRLADDVHLRPLAVDGTARLIRQRLAIQTVSDELVSLVHTRAQGNPFFTEELLKTLAEQEGLVHGEAHWRLTAAADAEVPRSVRSVVDRRVSRLASETQELLHLASVIGHEVELEVLVATAGSPEAVVLDHLDEALAAGFLREDVGHGLARYVFVHALVQQALYAGLSSRVRRQVHRQVGDVLERMRAAKPVVAAELARHFQAAGDADRAIRYSLQAGREASVRYAHSEAARSFRIAVELLRQRGERAQAAEAQHHLASELYDLNQTADALAEYESALETFEQLGDALGQARVHWGIALVHRGRYDIAAAVPHFQTALRLWPAERQGVELVSLQVDTARASLFGGDFAAARSVAAQAVDVAERSNAAGLLAQSLILVALARFRDDPRPQVMLEPLERAERAAQAACDWRALSYVYVTRASHCGWLSGQLDRLLADRRAAVDAAQRSGDTERLSFACRMLGSDYLDMGAWREGRELVLKGLALDPESALKGFPDSGLLAWMEGRPHDALAHIAAYVANARERHDVQGVSVGQPLFADMALQVDRLAEAEAPAREAAELLRVGGGWSPWPGNGWGPLAETAVRLPTTDAEQILTAAEHDIAASEQYIARPQLLRARGLLLQRQGDLDAATDVLKASAEIARSQSAGIQLGRTLQVLVTVARRRGNAALADQAETELADLVARIGPEVGALSWARGYVTAGAAMTVSKEVQSADAHANPLTARERQVAVLLARGLTNRQIATALVIAEGTAGVHVDHILNKLGFRSRAQVAAWAAEHGLIAAATD
jgi:DNA-binding CsgD family transcriptional regulator/tetratricopeptide (TPR) repeat protein